MEQVLFDVVFQGISFDPVSYIIIVLYHMGKAVVEVVTVPFDARALTCIWCAVAQATVYLLGTMQYGSRACRFHPTCSSEMRQGS